MTFVEVVTTIIIFRLLERDVIPQLVSFLNKKSKRKGKKNGKN